MPVTSNDIAKVIRETRKKLGITQKDLALAANTGLRFIIDLEKAKPSCELEKTLNVIQILGIKIILQPPAITKDNVKEK